MKIELRIQHYHGQTDGQTDRQTDTQSGFLSSLSELKIKFKISTMTINTEQTVSLLNRSTESFKFTLKD